ncbi:MAG: LysR family transcriptional regulator [Leptolyngbyaceae cyanobacterium SL_7_1]|nr:LysR family transcriptional regulator [Leptolyngbyaceae cyanobacterium SL_7_1]
MRVNNLDGIKLSQLRSLVAVAELGNFSEAALRLEVSQSAVSHSIAALEQELGVILVSRGRHGARLTPVGKLVLNHVQDMLRSLEAIGKEAHLAKGLDGGQVRIATFRSVGTHVLPEVIASFRKSFPNINVLITEYRGDTDAEQSVREGLVDLGFICIPISSEFESWEVMRDEYVVLLPPDWKPADSLLTWEELATYPMIMPHANDHCSMLIRNHLASLGQTVQAAYEIQEDSTIVSMVGRGLGAAILPRLAAEPLPPTVQVFQLPVPLERIIQVAILKDALHPPAVYAFLDKLKEMYQLKSRHTSRAKVAAQ